MSFVRPEHRSLREPYRRSGICREIEQQSHDEVWRTVNVRLVVRAIVKA
jgi:hypothetical protein